MHTLDCSVQVQLCGEQANLQIDALASGIWKPAKGQGQAGVRFRHRRIQ